VVEGRHPAEIAVRDVMTPEVVGCGADDDVEETFAAMRECQFRRMPVLDEGKPIGVITLGDLAKHVESPEKIAEKLREISEPHRNREAPEETPSREEAGSNAPETEGKPTASAA
jgi:predicted transcriptional regulator